jgi:hypothetical protein
MVAIAVSARERAVRHEAELAAIEETGFVKASELAG